MVGEFWSEDYCSTFRDFDMISRITCPMVMWQNHQWRWKKDIGALAEVLYKIEGLVGVELIFEFLKAENYEEPTMIV